MSPAALPAIDPGRGAFAGRLGLILFAGLLARVALVVYADRSQSRFDFPDSHRYLRVARNIAAGRGPIESPEIRAGTDPLYPALLGLGVRGGLDEDAQLLRCGRLINIAFALLSILLVAVLGRRLVSPAVGLLAAAICAIDPISVFFCALVMTETCYTALLLSALCALATISPVKWRRGAILCGLFLGLGAMTRSSSIGLALLLAPLAWFLARGGAARSRGPAAVGLMLMAMALALTPTIARNASLFGAFVPVRTGNGASLLESLGPWADGGPGMQRIVYPASAAGANELERDRICRAAALTWARENLSHAARLAITKLQRTWSISMNASDYSSPSYQWISRLSVGPEFLLALLGAGLLILRRRGRALLILLSPALYFSLVHMVFVGSVRYRVPVMPLVFVLSAVTLASIADRFRGRSDGDVPA